MQTVHHIYGDFERLTRQTANRPAKTETLLSTIHAHFGKELAETEVQAIVNRLTAQKRIRISPAGAVTCAL